MAKPILLSIDDDSDVLRAIERDLRSKSVHEYLQYQIREHKTGDSLEVK